jgi:hypothetical protein
LLLACLLFYIIQHIYVLHAELLECVNYGIT